MGTIPPYPTFAAGENPNAAKLNQIAAAGNFWGSPPRCYAFANSALTLASATATLVPLSDEVHDIPQPGDTEMHNVTTNNSRIVARTAGKYEISGQIEYAQNATGARSIFVRLNAAGSNATGSLLYQAITPAVSGNATTAQIATFEASLAIGDYIEMFAYQTSGSPVGIDLGKAQTFLRMKLSGS